MQNCLNSLTMNMEQQKIVYEDLLRLAKKKQEAITRGDVNELDYVVEGESLLLMKLSDIECERRNIIEATSDACGVPAEKLTFKNWPKSEKSEKNHIKALQKSFLNVLDEIHEVNGVNQHLIEIHLNYIKHVVEEAVLSVKTNSYEVNGTIKKSNESEPRLVDIRM